MENSQIRIAIIGGGLAGATLANALIRIPHISVEVFEAAPEFSERGAAVGLSPNAQRALEKTVEFSKQMLERAGSVAMASTRLMIGSGSNAGSLIADFGAMATEDPELIVHRASLLRELLAPLPNDILHPNKKLVGIKTMDSSIEIRFADNATLEFDAVIGADGVFSFVRNHVLEDENKNFSASPGGFWDCRLLVPFDKATATLGEELFKLDRQYGWTGDGAFIMHDVLENRTLVQMVISAVEREPPKDRKRILTKAFLEETLRTWKDGPIADGVSKLMLEQETPLGYSQWEHKSTPTYARGRVCIMGDAAHATTPWQGAGAGQAFEDAMILSALLGQVSSPESLDAAFKAYDVVRRPRGQQVIDSSRGTGTILCGQNPEVGLDPSGLMQALAPRWAFLEINRDAYIAEALAQFKALIDEQSLET